MDSNNHGGGGSVGSYIRSRGGIVGVEVATRSRMSHLSSRRPRIQDLHSSSTTTHMAGSHRRTHAIGRNVKRRRVKSNKTKKKNRTSQVQYFIYHRPPTPSRAQLSETFR